MATRKDATFYGIYTETKVHAEAREQAAKVASTTPSYVTDAKKLKASAPKLFLSALAGLFAKTFLEKLRALFDNLFGSSKNGQS